MGASDKTLSPALKRKLPPKIIMIFGMGRFYSVFGTALAAFFLLAPIFGHRDNSGLRYLIGPLLPFFAYAYSVIIPFNPYRGLAARQAGLAGYDKQDADARRLVELFDSRAARRFLLRTTIKLSAFLFLIVLVPIYVNAGAWIWSMDTPFLILCLIGTFIGVYLALNNEYTAWGLRIWGAQHAGEAHDGA